jgi:hypothetical protein
MMYVITDMYKVLFVLALWKYWVLDQPTKPTKKAN